MIIWRFSSCDPAYGTPGSLLGVNHPVHDAETVLESQLPFLGANLLRVVDDYSFF
ncbi:MAG: hypothetical protein ACE5OZ_11590 [Candidatus Heimdallarchaeota archaeon]